MLNELLNEMLDEILGKITGRLAESNAQLEYAPFVTTLLFYMNKVYKKIKA